MAAILMLLPGLWISLIGVAMVLNRLPPIVSLIVLIAILVGIIYLMIKFKAFRRTVLITVAILVICGFAGILPLVGKIIEGVITFAFILIYWFLIRD